MLQNSEVCSAFRKKTREGEIVRPGCRACTCGAGRHSPGRDPGLTRRDRPGARLEDAGRPESATTLLDEAEQEIAGYRLHLEFPRNNPEWGPEVCLREPRVPTVVEPYIANQRARRSGMNPQSAALPGSG